MILTDEVHPYEAYRCSTSICIVFFPEYLLNFEKFRFNNIINVFNFYYIFLKLWIIYLLQIIYSVSKRLNYLGTIIEFILTSKMLN